MPYPLYYTRCNVLINLEIADSLDYMSFRSVDHSNSNLPDPEYTNVSNPLSLGTFLSTNKELLNIHKYNKQQFEEFIRYTHEHGWSFKLGFFRFINGNLTIPILISFV